MKRKLVFTHIPKTAGVSVRAIVGAKYPETRILHIENPVEFFSGNVSSVLPGYDFVHGHFSAETALQYFDDEFDLMVFLRDPVKRVISYYYFLRMFDESTYKGTDVEKRRIALAKSASLSEFVALTDKAVKAALSNRQLSFISEQKKGKPLVERLNEAKEVLESRYSFVGITESMDQSLQLLAYKQNLCNPYASPVLNASVKDYDDDYADALAIIKERNSVDIELYEFAKSRFQRDYYAMVDTLLTSDFEENVVGRMTPVKLVNLTMEAPAMGRGWYERECKHGITWRFGGPDSASSLYFPRLDLKTAILKFYINCFESREVMETLRVFVNGIQVNVSKGCVNNMGQEYIARLDERIITAKPFVRIDFIVAEARVPVTSSGESMDNRRLSVAVTSVTIEPQD